MDTLTVLRHSKKVGILIAPNLHIFSSGLIQNAYFIYQCVSGLNIPCEFLTVEDDVKPFGYKNIPLKKLPQDFSEYHIIITVSTGLTKEEYDRCRVNKVSVVNFICGNQFMHDIETFVLGDAKGRGAFIGKNSFSDELWVIPCYKFTLTYFETIRNKTAFIVPHLWSPCILEDSAKNKTMLPYSIQHDTKKLNLLIAEPNISLFKNAWLPIVSAEYLHIKNPSLIEQVFAFNWPDNQHAYKMSDSLQLGAKLRRFSRQPMSEVMPHFNAQTAMPIFVSYQINNSLNYLYYECLYFGYPLVHNSPELEGCGYYYPENDVAKCAEAILYAQKHHHKHLADYIVKGRKYLERVDPLNGHVANTWKQYIDSMLIKHV
jgi:hypothetical protein